MADYTYDGGYAPSAQRVGARTQPAQGGYGPRVHAPRIQSQHGQAQHGQAQHGQERAQAQYAQAQYAQAQYGQERPQAQYGAQYAGTHYAPQPEAAAMAGRRASVTNLAGAVASLALIVGVGVWGYGVMARDVSGVPVVMAATGPMRIAPQEPGGTEADHQGLAVNAVAGLGAAEGPAGQLLLAPVPAGLAAEDVASNAMVAVDDTGSAMPVALTQDGAVPQLGSTESDSEADPILALVSQIAADNAPLTALPEPAVAAIPTDGSDLLGDIDGDGDTAAYEDTSEEDTEVASYTGPGLARSLRPQLRPGGVQVAAVSAGVSEGTSVDAAVVAAIGSTSASTTRELDAETLPVGTRLVQIGAFDSPETARVEWSRLEGRFGEFLDGKGRVIQQAQSGGRTFYRLRAEGFVDLADARRFCAAFVAEKVDCIPVVTK